MRKIIETNDLGWEARETLEGLLNVSRLPKLIIIETVEED